MKFLVKFRAPLTIFFAAAAVNAHALDLDWSGQFRAEATRISNYTADSSDAGQIRDASRESAGGYYIPSAGSKTASFQSLFLRLKPNVIVNDNVSIKSEIWFGNPITGFYGDGFPATTRSDQRFFSTSYSGGSTVTAQRFWADVVTDFGLLQVGRAPIHWGLGLVHHSGDGLWDRYQSTGDVIRLTSKFGNFSVIPASTKYAYGNSVGGTCNGNPCTTSPFGGSTLNEYSLGLRYFNPDEDFDAGFNFIRRIGGAQNTATFLNASTPGSVNYTIWDIYMKKRAGKFDFAVEAPIFNGRIIGIPYKTYALAGEAKYSFNDAWSVMLRAGKVPGQPNAPGGNTQKWTMAYLHPNYRLGMLMFGMQPRNFAGNNNPNNPAGGEVRSVYDNPITNANYASLGGAFRTDKWTFGLTLMTASADKTAANGQSFFNTWDRRYYTANGSQSSSLGTELDLTTNFDWDDFTSFGVDLAYYKPGNYYAFSNDATKPNNATSAMMGFQARVGVKF